MQLLPVRLVLSSRNWSAFICLIVCSVAQLTALSQLTPSSSFHNAHGKVGYIRACSTGMLLRTTACLISFVRETMCPCGAEVIYLSHGRPLIVVPFIIPMSADSDNPYWLSTVTSGMYSIDSFLMVASETIVAFTFSPVASVDKTADIPCAWTTLAVSTCRSSQIYSQAQPAHENTCLHSQTEQGIRAPSGLRAWYSNWSCTRVNFLFAFRFILWAKYDRCSPLPCAVIIYLTGIMMRALKSNRYQQLHRSLIPTAFLSKGTYEQDRSMPETIFFKHKSSTRAHKDVSLSKNGNQCIRNERLSWSTEYYHPDRGISSMSLIHCNNFAFSSVCTQFLSCPSELMCAVDGKGLQTKICFDIVCFHAFARESLHSGWLG